MYVIISPLCVSSFSSMGVCIRIFGQKCKVCKMKKNKNSAHLYLGIYWHNLLQIWGHLSSKFGLIQERDLRATYVGVIITFCVFLSIYSRCSVMTSWVTWHTTMCLDILGKGLFLLYNISMAKYQYRPNF